MGRRIRRDVRRDDVADGCRRRSEQLDVMSASMLACNVCLCVCMGQHSSTKGIERTHTGTCEFPFFKPSPPTFGYIWIYLYMVYLREVLNEMYASRQIRIRLHRHRRRRRHHPPTVIIISGYRTAHGNPVPASVHVMCACSHGFFCPNIRRRPPAYE